MANATSLEEAAALVAWKVWDAFPGPRIVFKANQTPLIMSPFQVLRAGFASCVFCPSYRLAGVLTSLQVHRALHFPGGRHARRRQSLTNNVPGSCKSVMSASEHVVKQNRAPPHLPKLLTW